MTGVDINLCQPLFFVFGGLLQYLCRAKGKTQDNPKNQESLGLPITPKKLYFTMENTIHFTPEVNIHENDNSVRINLSTLTGEERRWLTEIFGKKVAGRMSVEGGTLTFTPYPSNPQQKTFHKSETVGQTKVQVTTKLAKFSISLPRTTSKDIMCLTLMEENNGVVRRLREGLYESMIRTGAQGITSTAEMIGGIAA